MARKKFIRRNWDKYKRLGRKKKRVWRKSRGIHAKIRKRRKGYPSRPEIGMKKPIEMKKEIKFVRNLQELARLKKNDEAIIASIGKKKRAEIEKKAGELGVRILNKKQEKAEDKKEKGK